MKFLQVLAETLFHIESIESVSALFPWITKRFSYFTGWKKSSLFPKGLAREKENTDHLQIIFQVMYRPVFLVFNHILEIN